MLSEVAVSNYQISDSLYMALSGRSIDELVKPELKSEWLAEKSNWFPRTDTRENALFDSRTPGIVGGSGRYSGR